MKTFYLTDAGKVRGHNEDSVTILKNKSNEYILMVADGMGGHRKGEVASMIAITHLGKRFTEIASIGTKYDAVNWLNDNVSEINKNILDYTVEHSDSLGMGSTLVVAIQTKDFLIFGNIGDSSGYVMKNKKLHKVTKDHTLVNLLVEAGNLTEEEAKYHPKKNVLMRALGATEKVQMDIFDVERTVDGIFLCSDWLTNMLTKEQIENDDLTNPENIQIAVLDKDGNTLNVGKVEESYLYDSEGNEIEILEEDTTLENGKAKITTIIALAGDNKDLDGLKVQAYFEKYDEDQSNNDGHSIEDQKYSAENSVGEEIEI